MKIRKEITEEDVVYRPSHFCPSWFKLSPSMIRTISHCREQFVWNYIRDIKPRKVNVALPRGSCVHFILETMLNPNVHSLFKSVEGLYDMFIRNDLKEKAMIDGIPLGKTDAKKWNDSHIEYVFNSRYEFPKGNFAFTYDEFVSQCISAATATIEYIKEHNIKPLINPETKNPCIELNLFYELGVAVDFGKPVMLRSIIDYLADDLTIIDWKCVSKQTKEKNIEAIVNEPTYNYAIALRKWAEDVLGEVVEDVNIKLVRSVVNKKGQCVTVETHECISREEDTNAKIFKDSCIADDIMNMRLYKERDKMRCSFCDFKDICIYGETKNYVKEIYVRDDEVNQ